MNQRRDALLRLAGLACIVGAGALAATLTPLGDYLTRDGVGEAIEWLRSSRMAPVLYITVYALATALAMPGSIMTLAGGAVFGFALGTVYTTIAANIGANLAFAVGRLLGRDGVRVLTGDRLRRVDRVMEQHGFRGLLMLRLIPVVPFNALNFGSGLTSISWSAYAAATVVGIFPGTLIYTFFADALLVGSQEVSRGALLRVLGAGTVLLGLSFVPAAARRLGIRIPGATLSGILILSTASLAEAQRLPAHDAFSDLLNKVVSPPSVDYAALSERQGLLDDYLGTLGNVETMAIERAGREEQLAFWINAYNACMLRLVAEHYPIQRARGLFAVIRNTVAGRPANSVWQIPGVFTARHCRIAGQMRSQDEIEHEILRPMGDPRIHFAVNCAARSCPILWPEAYEARDLSAQLDRAIRTLVSNPDHFSIGPDFVRMNQVFNWFKEDFGGINGLRSFFAPYLDSRSAVFISSPDTRIEFFSYDWTLNDLGR